MMKPNIPLLGDGGQSITDESVRTASGLRL